MDAVEILGKLDEIVEAEDKNVASENIVNFKEYINEEAAKDTAIIEGKDQKISELTEKVSKLETENEEVRKHNNDILLKYGAMAEKMASNIGDYKPVNPEPQKPKSWAEISKMD